jgi:hydrogenase maturation protein HypF
VTAIKEHIQINIKGLVQGIGFRPFIYRLAKQYQQFGWIANTGHGVTIELEGEPAQQQRFILSLQNQAPPFAEIKSLTIHPLPLSGYQTFDFKNSITSDNKSSFVLPDISTCPECVSELFDPASRFYRYPFTSCCHCGPRYSIMQAQPYDRSRTSMAEFELCQVCEKDFENPDNRRFHAQTLACEDCGPHISMLDHNGNRIAEREQALETAIKVLHDGKILALKGIGGYQLLADARNNHAIAKLRKRKNRPRKPFALMLPSMEAAHELCFINKKEQQALTSAASPIVLLQRRPDAAIMESVAPDNSLLGIMLPYSPLHHLLMHDFDAPVIATSGNQQNEPICINQEQAFDSLQGIADFFLNHNRAILRPLDDSIVRLIGNKTTTVRRARGYVPSPITLRHAIPETLAVGGHLKNTVAISRGNQVILSQHLGDLDSMASQQQFEMSLADMLHFYQVKPDRVMHDLHPGYTSSQYAGKMGIPNMPVQHHYAHILSCIAEHGIQPPVLGISWDGTGLGTDNELWGGEFLLITENGFDRFSHLRPFPLPGGTKAILEPRRAALGLLYELLGDDLFNLQDSPCLDSFTKQELNILKIAMHKQLNMPCTSSAGRLFDAVASLSGLCQMNSYEGEAAIQLESAANSVISDLSYPYKVRQGSPVIIDWQQTIESIIGDFSEGQQALIPAKFHNTLAEMVLDIALKANQSNIVLSGGCFQNACLVNKILQRLQDAGFNVFQHEKIPPNDGGLALGQLMASMYI